MSESVMVMAEPWDEVRFYAPHTRGCRANLKLVNQGSQPVHYKLLTTHPTSFCVKPKVGMLEAEGGSVDISISLRNEDTHELEGKVKFKVLLAEETQQRCGDHKAIWTLNSPDSYPFLRFACRFINEPEPSTSDCGQLPNIKCKDSDSETGHADNYETSGSSLSLKPVDCNKGKIKQTGTLSYPVRYLILSVVIVVVVSIAAAKLFFDAPLIA